MAAGLRSRWLSILLIGVSALLQGCPGGAGGGGTPAGPDDGGPADVPRGITFSKSFGGSGFDEASAAIRTADGGYVFVGTRDGSHSALGGDGERVRGGDVWISKLDADGVLQWQRAVGERSPSDPGRERKFTVARAAPDGGYIIAGSVTDRASLSNPTATGDDAWVAKLSASGSLQWSRDLDSGSWTNFDFAAPFAGRGNAADDIALDVRPAAGGGYIVVGKSVANLLVGERQGEEFAPGARVFLDAVSIVVWKVDAEGNDAWRRRLTDGQFTGSNDPISNETSGIQGPRLAAASDGGALIAYGVHVHTGHRVDNRLHVRRFDDSGVQIWNRVDEQDGFFTIPKIMQTDDADPAGRRDGQRNDGFLIVVAFFSEPSVALRLRSDGSVDWRREYGTADVQPSLVAADQFCITLIDGRTNCDFIFAGSHRSDTTNNVEGVLLVVDDSGDPVDGPIVHADVEEFVDIVSVEPVPRHTAVAHVAGMTQRVVIGGFGLPIVDRSQSIERTDAAELGRDRTLILSDLAQTIARFRPDPDTQSAGMTADGTVELDHAQLRTDVGVGVVESTAGSFIVAGHSASFESDVRPQGWVLRVTNGTVDWQRRFDVGEGGLIQGIARANDGGAVIAGWLDGAGRAIRLAADGSEVWRSTALIENVPDIRQFGVKEIQRTADGGYVVVSLGSLPGDPPPFSAGDMLIVSRLEDNGTLRWSRRYEPLTVGFGNSSIQQTDDDGDGAADDGFIVAGPHVSGFNSLFVLLKLDPQGVLSWNRAYTTTVGGAVDTLVPVKVRQTTDGGYVVSLTEQAILTREDPGVPFGERNAMVFKLSATGDVLWSRSYGALFDEYALDLQVLPDDRILVAGASNSLGDRSEGWLLQLGPDGLVAAGCNAFLGSMPVVAFGSGSLGLSQREIGAAVAALPPSNRSAVTAAAAITPETVEARQCLGVANPVDAPSAQRFTLTVTQPGTLTGAVVSTPAGIVCGTASDSGCSGSFAAGDVFLAVDPASAATFLRWEDCAEVIAPTAAVAARCRVRMDRDRSVRAIFGQPRDRFQLRMTIQGTGTVTSGDQGIRCGAFFGGGAQDCEHLYDAVLPGTDLPTSVDLGVFTHRADFASWGGDCAAAGASRSLSLVMNSDKACTATFVGPGSGNQVLLEVVVAGPGGEIISSDDGINCTTDGPDCQEVYEQGESVGLGFNLLQTGATFQGWGGDCEFAGTAERFALVMDSPKRCTARFSSGTPTQQFALTVQRVGFGSVVASTPAGIDCGSNCTANFDANATVRLAVTPNPGFTLGGWTGCDRTPQGTTAPFDCEVDMTSAKTVQVRIE